MNLYDILGYNIYSSFFNDTEEDTAQKAVDEDYLRILLEQNLIGLEHEVPVHNNESLI